MDYKKAAIDLCIIFGCALIVFGVIWLFDKDVNWWPILSGCCLGYMAQEYWRKA